MIMLKPGIFELKSICTTNSLPNDFQVQIVQKPSPSSSSIIIIKHVVIYRKSEIYNKKHIKGFVFKRCEKIFHSGTSYICEIDLSNQSVDYSNIKVVLVGKNTSLENKRQKLKVAYSLIEDIFQLNLHSMCNVMFFEAVENVKHPLRWWPDL